jgi:hypothetical protein
MVAFSFSIFSCDSSQVKKKASKKTVKKYRSLKTKAVMMERLKEFGFKIPEKLEFEKIKKKTSRYTAYFKAENLDEAAIKELDSWYIQQISDLVAVKWKKRAIRENDTIVGLTVNHHLFYRPKGGKSSLSNSIDLSSSYSTRAKSYSLYISPNNY